MLMWTVVRLGACPVYAVVIGLFWFLFSSILRESCPGVTMYPGFILGPLKFPGTSIRTSDFFLYSA